MNTLIEIALTTQPLKACHCPTVELLCLLGEVMRADGSIRTNKSHYNFGTYFTQLIPDLLINTHTQSLTLHPL